MLYNQVLIAIIRASAFLNVYLQAGEGFKCNWEGCGQASGRQEKSKYENLVAKLNCFQENEKGGKKTNQNKKLKKPQHNRTHNAEKLNARRDLISFILVGWAPCGCSPWLSAQQRRWCALYESSGLPDELYHRQSELCPFSCKLLASLKQAGVSWLSPYRAKKVKPPVQLALAGSDVCLYPGWRTEVPQGVQEG